MVELEDWIVRMIDIVQPINGFFLSLGLFHRDERADAG
jgi:hypothetical protein